MQFQIRVVLFPRESAPCNSHFAAPTSRPHQAPLNRRLEKDWTMRSVLESVVDQVAAANRTPATKAEMTDEVRGQHQLESGPDDVNRSRS